MIEKEESKIYEILTDIRIAQGVLGETTKGIKKNIENIDKHLEKQNGTVDSNVKKLVNHAVWIKIISAVLIALLVGTVTSFLK